MFDWDLIWVVEVAGTGRLTATLTEEGDELEWAIFWEINKNNTLFHCDCYLQRLFYVWS